MKNFYSFLVLAASISVSAQTTITKSNNDYLPGNTISSRNVVGTPDNSAAGANVTFDNSMLTDGSAVMAQVSTPSASDLSTFPGTTVKFDDGNGNLFYYKSTATQLEITGATVSGAVLNFSADNALFLKFPTAFGDTYNDTARGTFSNGLVNGLFKGNITTTADASGTLLLGSDVYANVLRVKTVQNYNLYQSTDTNYILAIGSLVSTIYTYYDSTHRYPLFTATTATISVPILGINQTSTAAIAQNTSALATAQAGGKNTVTVYPNPVKDIIYYSGAAKGYQNATVYTMEGKIVRRIGITSGKSDISGLATGMYILKLSGQGMADQTVSIIKK